MTQLDIARLANVSQATVSRVLSGDDRVEIELRDRVVQVIQEHNYQPDVRARSLRLKRTGLIGLVIKRPHGGLTDDPFFAALTAGIMDHLCGKPYHLCVDVVTDEIAQGGIYDEMLRTRRVDGLILVEAEALDERITRLQNDKFPFVMIGDPKNDDIASVDNDNVHCGEIATRHLIKQGYRRIGILGGPRRINFSNDRIEGYTNAMSAAGLNPLVWHSDFGFEAARKTALEIFDGPHRPDAMVVLDDFMTFGVVTAARARYIKVPDHLGLVSFNNTSLCQLLEEGLTSVDLGMARMVELAVKKLLEIIEEGEATEPKRQIVPAQIIQRGSCNRPVVPPSLEASPPESVLAVGGQR
ncbi:MAG: LacI family DNA-binding transcriptional regulator [Fimbriimonas sp.]